MVASQKLNNRHYHNHRIDGIKKINHNEEKNCTPCSDAWLCRFTGYIIIFP